MRLFIALPFSEQIQNYLESLLTKLPEAKMTLNHHFHITLQFLGDVSVEQAQEIQQALKKISFPKMNLKLTEIGVFKNYQGFIKVVWVGITFPEELKKLQKDIETSMKQLGFKPDKPFSPHLTLARIKFADDKVFEEQLKKINLDKLEDTASKIILFESVLSSYGASYNELLTIQAHD